MSKKVSRNFSTQEKCSVNDYRISSVVSYSYYLPHQLTSNYSCSSFQLFSNRSSGPLSYWNYLYAFSSSTLFIFTKCDSNSETSIFEFRMRDFADADISRECAGAKNINGVAYRTVCIQVLWLQLIKLTKISHLKYVKRRPGLQLICDNGSFSEPRLCLIAKVRRNRSRPNNCQVIYRLLTRRI